MTDTDLVDRVVRDFEYVIHHTNLQSNLILYFSFSFYMKHSKTKKKTKIENEISHTGNMGLI